MIRAKRAWLFAGGQIELGRRTVLMGVLNVTPDSFSDGGKYLKPESAIAHGLKMAGQGAGIIDVGGESSRPGAERVSAEEQCRRTLPVILGIRQADPDLPISIDTPLPEVAARALEAGANIVNDISGLGAGEEMTRLIAQSGAGAVLMHMRGMPETMQQLTHYEDLIGEIRAFLADRADQLVRAGAGPEQIILDPGIGFAKTPEQNLEIIRSLARFRSLGYPVLIGPSRKSFIGKILDVPVEDRLWGTAAAVALSIANGADVIRVHDVEEISQVARMTDAIIGAD